MSRMTYKSCHGNEWNGLTFLVDVTTVVLYTHTVGNDQSIFICSNLRIEPYKKGGVKIKDSLNCFSFRQVILKRQSCMLSLFITI